MKRGTLVFWSAIALLIAGFGVVVYFRMQPPANRMDPANMPQAVSVQKVEPGSIDVTYSTQATIEAKEHVAMNSEIQGVVVRVAVNEGQYVNKGTPLIYLKADRQQADVAQSSASVQAYQQAVQSQQALISQAQASVQAAQAEVDAAQASARLAETEFNDYQRLFQQDIISRLELDQRRTTVETARAQLSAAQQRLAQARGQIAQAKASKAQTQAQLQQARAGVAYQQAALAETTIRAPFSGRVGVIFVDPGDYVTQAEQLITMVGSSGVEVVMQVPERLLDNLHLNQTIPIRDTAPLTLTDDTESLPDNSLIGTGRISFIDPTIDPLTRTATLKGQLLGEAATLMDGRFVNASIVLETRTHTVVIPESAIMPQGERYYVYVAEQQRSPSDKSSPEWRAKLTQVQLGARQPGVVEVTQGLQFGQMVVTDGVLKLFDGALLGIQQPGQASKQTSSKAVGKTAAHKSKESNKDATHKASDKDAA